PSPVRGSRAADGPGSAARKRLHPDSSHARRTARLSGRRTAVPGCRKAPELRAAAALNLGTASVEGRYELSNVHISSVHNSFSGFGTGDYGDVAYAGDVVLDGVEITFGGNLTGISLTGRSISV